MVCEWKKTFAKEADQIVVNSPSFRTAQSEFEATITFTDPTKVKLFTAENELSNKTAVSLNIPLVVITGGCGHRHLEYLFRMLTEMYLTK